MTTRLVSFDVWRTLLVNNPEYRQIQYELVRKAIGYPGALDELRRLNRLVYAELDRETEQHGLHFGLYERIARLVRHAGLTAPSADALAALKHELREAHLTHPPFLTEATLPRLFTELKERGIRLAVISNTNTTDGAVVHEALAHHGLAQHLDYELYSDEVGFAKPDPRIFAELVNRSGIASEHITHVGDDPVTDRRGARNAGLGAILYEQRRRCPETRDVIWSHSNIPALVAAEETSC